MNGFCWDIDIEEKTKDQCIVNWQMSVLFSFSFISCCIGIGWDWNKNGWSFYGNVDNHDL